VVAVPDGTCMNCSISTVPVIVEMASTEQIGLLELSVTLQLVSLLLLQLQLLLMDEEQVPLLTFSKI
jgi:hypothetical protein